VDWIREALTGSWVLSPFHPTPFVVARSLETFSAPVTHISVLAGPLDSTEPQEENR
jgi:hypothetical protein